MKVKNIGNNPVWIEDIKLMPNEERDISDKYEPLLKSLGTVIITGESEIDDSPSVKEYELLLKLRGVEKELAEEILDRFGSIEGVRNATLKELEAIPGIGKKRAILIKKQLDEDEMKG